jgi:hypothetical protein
MTNFYLKNNLKSLVDNFKSYKKKSVYWSIFYIGIATLLIFTNPTSRDLLDNVNDGISKNIEKKYGVPAFITEMGLKIGEEKLKDIELFQRNNYIVFSTFTLNDNISVLEEFQVPKIVGIGGYYFEPNLVDLEAKKVIVNMLTNKD